MRLIQLEPEQLQLLQEFEAGLDPAHPEQGPLGPRIIGYGEMSTVFTFEEPRLQGLACKRMALFETEAEIEAYAADYLQYHTRLQAAGVRTPDYGYARITTPRGQPVLYLLQMMLQPDSICHKLLPQLNTSAALHLFDALMDSIAGVYRYAANDPEFALGFDAQLSNWSLQNKPDTTPLTTPQSIELIYIDTSTPLMRTAGREHLDPELFLRICPASLVWIVRRFFLADVMDRYYEPQLVVLDLIANLNKEGRPDLIEPLLQQANSRLEQLYTDLEKIMRGRQQPHPSFQLQPFRALTVKQVRAYYKEDAFIWRLFLALRRLERGWRKLRGQKYPLILPGKIKR
ncbi:MAG: hypothetical protein KDK39_13545 [Leptospiraceae bacterium]|nr:hypothetical protein [Leptospiraceae bacterium]